VIHGADGPHSVIATGLHSILEPEKRKVLAFADGRQEAAFFAWYVEKSYEMLRNRSYFLEVIKRAGSGGDGLSVSDLCSLLADEYARRGVLGPAATHAEIMRAAGAAALSEILSTRSRISLEGVGLVRWEIKRPPWIKPPAVFTDPPWHLSQEVAWHLASLLFDTARSDGAVRWPEDPRNPISWRDIGTEIRQHWYTSGAPRSRGAQKSWAGRFTRRTIFLAKVYEKLRGAPSDVARAEAEAALYRLWVDAREHDLAARKDSFFVQGPEGVALNLAWWRFYPVEKVDVVYVCDTCGQVAAVDTFGICTRPRCWGTTRVVPLQELPEDHYRALYQCQFPGEFRAEEHTAQLAAKKAQQYQKDFKEGRIHLLSSSTTFELGVDIGDLDTVFLRNVPPQPFNYVQRVGRAGRRPGQPGMAITYCRRNPHDLYHFARPDRILSGRLEHPPVTSLKNTKVILFFQMWDKAEPEPADPGLGVVTRTYIVPVFGFVTGRQLPQEPRRRPARQYTTRPYFAKALGTDTESVAMPSNGKPLIFLKKAFPGRMVELCEGRRKTQFWICPVCGAGIPGERTYPGKHLDPYGQQCSGVPERVSLAHEFETDVVEVRFLMPWWPAARDAAWVEHTGAFRVAQVPSRAPSVEPVAMLNDSEGWRGCVWLTVS